MASYAYQFTSGDVVTPTKLNDARTVSEIVNADISATAAIAGTKIAPDFGSQNVVTTGKVISGSPNAFVGAGSLQPAIQAQSTSVSASSLGLYSFNTTATQSGRIDLGRTRGALGQYNVVQSGDHLGIVRFTGGDGTQMLAAAEIRAEVDGTPGTNDMPGRLVFSTTADGASSPTERVHIQADGKVGIGTSSPSYLLDVTGIINTASVYAVDGLQVVGNRRTGWTAPTGTATRATFDSGTVTLSQLAARVHALIDDLAAHGLIDN